MPRAALALFEADAMVPLHAVAVYLTVLTLPLTLLLMLAVLIGIGLMLVSIDPFRPLIWAHTMRPASSPAVRSAATIKMVIGFSAPRAKAIGRG